MAIIGGKDMSYMGAARNPVFTKKINGTHTLTFEMPDRYFDSEKGEYVRNELIDAIFPECKIKYHYKDKWYEFYVKQVSDAKKFKSYMKTFSCSDSFIDELARNGYGIVFDEELYNNVEEVGTFSDEILEDSVWEYDAHLNWGDFTEYTEEKLFKIPLSLFGNSLKAHKVNFSLEDNYEILNIFTGETRAAEMGDDLAREKGQFWDQYQNGTKNKLLGSSITLTNADNDYIYVPYSQLDFCYVSSDSEGDNGLEEAFIATEYPATYGNKGYAIAPNSINPNQLIQFMFIPKNEKIEIDEAGLILNKNFTYVMTVAEWNKQLNSVYFYKFEDYKEDGFKKKVLTQSFSNADYIYGNKAAYYEDYLTEIDESSIDNGLVNNVDSFGNSHLTILGKKFSITDRTEINISEEVDQYVKVYNNPAADYQNLYMSEDWIFNPTKDSQYRVCSKQETRQIVPQLARNLLQNSKEISSTTGWEIMESFPTSQTVVNAKLNYCCLEQIRGVKVPEENYTIEISEVKESYLVFTPCYVNSTAEGLTEKNAALNFGIVGQEKTLEKGKTYVLGISLRPITDYTKDKINYNTAVKEGKLENAFIRIGTGKMIKDGDYVFDSYFDVPINTFKRGNAYSGYILLNLKNSYTNPYLAIYSAASYELLSCEFFEAYTKGVDQFDSGYFRYSGRDLFAGFTPRTSTKYNYSDVYLKEQLSNLILFEDDVMPGDTYAYERYFIQKLQLKNLDKAYDTFMAKKYLDENASKNSAALPLNSGQYTEDDFDIITNYIDLNNCQYYNASAAATAYDCKCGSNFYDKVCLYQKYGYCPYRFQTEKHCRRIRTLKGEKSNRFNLTQELGKVFEVYPVYYISHSDNGKILTQEQAREAGTRTNITAGRENWMDKRVFYITEKGKENKLGFRYEKNLSDISRTIQSNQIVTKLYVLDNDSDISKTGLCSIKTAEDNPSKDNFIIDFSYYIAQGLLNKEKTEADLYGKDENDLGFLKTLGYLNTQYDRISNQIINLSAASFTELKANLDVNLTGIETAQKQLRKLEKIMSRYTIKTSSSSYLENSTFQSYQYEYIEQNAIYVQLIEDTFYSNGRCIYGSSYDYPPANFLDNMSIDDVKEQWVDTHNYDYGILGQYNREYKQIKEWTKEQASYLKRINDLSASFYRKYEPFLKEGTWSDGNYISDNAYYFGALDVAKQGAIPKVSYSITVVDIESLYREGDYEVDVADNSYVEDIGMFGVNYKTGLPNRLKVLITAITESPDNPSENKIEVQNFTTQFEDLFSQVTATVQSLTFNENIYRRSSNFTSLQNIETESLQGTLDKNDVTLVNTQEQNIKIDQEGQSGSDINNHNCKYKLNGQGLFFSNNGGQSWNVGVGPNGINADYIKAGTLDASKIRIVDGEYMYFSWDRNGITAFRDPRTVRSAEAFLDYAQFNKFGLSLVEKGQIKLRAGYAFNGNNGKADTEKEVSPDANIGFYLYNSAGNPIFSTESSSNTGSTQARETARINLIGEMLVTNDTEVSSYQGYKYGGEKYNLTSSAYYEIGNTDNLLEKAFIDQKLTITGSSGEFVVGGSSLISNIQYAGAVFFYHQDLTSITIKEDQEDVGTTYNSPSFTIEGQNYFGQILNGANQRYVYFTYGRVSFEGVNITNCAILHNDTLNEDIYKPINSLGTQKNVNILTWDEGTDISRYRLNSTTASGIYVSENFYDGYTYYKNKTFGPAYKIGNSYYTAFLGDASSTGEGSVSLYLNNRTDLRASSSGNSRLFVCCNSSRTDNIVHNIFSILKDGSLHIGGTISGVSSSTALPDQIAFNGDEALIVQGGRLLMSFDGIVDKNSGQSIVNYITNELNGQSAQIINQITGRSHYHTVDWQRYEGGYIDGVYVDYRDIWVKVNLNGTDTSLRLYDLLNMAGFYNTFYTGYAGV